MPTRTTRPIALLPFLCLLLVLAAGCGRRATVAAPFPPEASLAVAGFTQPQYTWQLLAGYIPEQRTMVETDALVDLDRLLIAQLLKDKDRHLLGPSTTRQCQELATFDQKAGRGAALKYWTEVGRCLPADYLLVPQLMDMRERQGSSKSVKTPAAVAFDFYVIDVAQGELLARYHFDEKQMSLADNLLDIGKFFSRGGRWLTADELATEGITQGLKELGL
ncbi:MAG: hypothetical protein AB7E47_00325 [Desulfovibrionaceae bacterium]